MDKDESTQSVQLIDRTFAVLEIIAKNGTMSLKDVYTSLGLNKASTFRIVNALCSNGYLKRDEKSGEYSLTFKAYEIGIATIRRVDYITFIRETVDKMSSDLGVIAQYSIDDCNELLCIESFDTTRANFSVYNRVGQRSPLYATSAGKAILSTYSDEEIARKWANMNVRAYTSNTITDLNDFMQEIYVIRQRNYAVDMEETEPGLFCVGTALLNYNHRAIGAISLSTNHMTDELLQRLSNSLLTQTQRLSYMLSYSMK